MRNNFVFNCFWENYKPQANDFPSHMLSCVPETWFNQCSKQTKKPIMILRISTHTRNFCLIMWWYIDLINFFLNWSCHTANDLQQQRKMSLCDLWLTNNGLTLDPWLVTVWLIRKYWKQPKNMVLQMFWECKLVHSIFSSLISQSNTLKKLM